MNKKLLFVSLLFISLHSHSQSCNIQLKDKGKIDLHIKTWSGPMFTDMKFTKYKDEKKDELVAAFNASVDAGTTAAASDYPLTYHYTKTTSAAGDEYKMGTTIAGVDYYSYEVCKNDTFFFVRNRGVITTPNGSGGVLAYSIQGIQILPMKMKVGDTLPVFTDINVGVPSSTDMIVQKNIIDHYSTSTSNGFGYAPDDKGNMVLGPTIETKTSAVWKTIDVAVKKTIAFNGHSLHFSFVTGEEEITFNGVKYKAMIIDAETWTKQKMDVDFESADAQVQRQQQAFAEKVQNRMNRLMVRRQFTNKEGYMVMYSRSWFVPSIGILKTESYDPFGAISSRTVYTAFE